MPAAHAHTWLPLLSGVRVVLSVLCLSTIAFYAWAALLARRLFTASAPDGDNDSPGISVLKPVCGIEPNALANFDSFFRQEYPKWEILFGAEHANDPGLEAARRIAERHPGVDATIVSGNGIPGTNPKVRTLAALARAAKHPLLLVSDSDILVDRLHLRRMAAPLRDPATAVTTCLYRTNAEGVWGRLDALALSTEFVPGALVARRLEGMTFAMGAGILIRRDVLERIGGFARIADCLADDYLLGNLPYRAGYGVALAHEIVDHGVSTRSLRDLVARQIRWNLGIRIARPWSYAGLGFMQGTAAALLLLVANGASLAACSLAAATTAVRLAAAWSVTDRLGDSGSRRLLWLVPLRDLLSTALWVAGFFGRTIVWRGHRFRLEAGGRLRERPA